MILSHLGQAPRIDPSATVASTATVCGDVTLGPGCRVLPGATVVAEGGRIQLGRRCIVMENAVVRATARHDVAVGDPAEILPPDQHDRIWAIQRPLDFPATVYGVARGEAAMVEITSRLSEALAAHGDDEAS